jgi:predicted alpha/beta superfamily hydrolase
MRKTHFLFKTLQFYFCQSEELLCQKNAVYLPKDYVKFDKRYPVIYMHDGQNLFDVKSWHFAGVYLECVDET